VGCQTRLDASYIEIQSSTHSGTLLQDVSFPSPTAVLFFNRSPTKLIVACSDEIFTYDTRTQTIEPFSSTPQWAFYNSHALALSADDAVLVAGNYNSRYNVCGYDTASHKRLWTYNAADEVGAVCMLGAHVLASVNFSPTLVLDRDTGNHKASLKTRWIYGLGVIEGLCFIHSFLSFSQTSTPPCTSPCCSNSSTSKHNLCICRWRCGTGSQSTACSCDRLL